MIRDVRCTDRTHTAAKYLKVLQETINKIAREKIF